MAMKNDKGETKTDAKGMIEILQAHWAKVFGKREVDNQMLIRWLNEMYPKGMDHTQERKRDANGRAGWRSGLPTNDSGKWEVKRKGLARAIKQSKNSSPGPDGLPYKVWRELGDTGVNVLWDAMAEMHEANALDILEEAYGGEHEFNGGVMPCLPKSSIGVTEHGEDIYDAASTRPLSIVNTDNRLMCGAARLRWETIFNSRVLFFIFKGRQNLDAKYRC